jgi:hypothetical protein
MIQLSYVSSPVARNLPNSARATPQNFAEPVVQVKNPFTFCASASNKRPTPPIKFPLVPAADLW